MSKTLLGHKESQNKGLRVRSKVSFSWLWVSGLILITLAVFSQQAMAHPGRKRADGCHKCWTNCEKWGVKYGEDHCG